MRRSKGQETKPPPLPDEALREVEQAIVDLALTTRATYRTQRHYVYILVDEERLCRLEYLGEGRQWALDMFQGEGRGYGVRGEGRFYRSTGEPAHLIGIALEQRSQVKDQQVMVRVAFWLAAHPILLMLFWVLVLPVLTPLRWGLQRMRLPPPEEQSPV